MTWVLLMGMVTLSMGVVLAYLSVKINDEHLPIKYLLWVSVFYFMLLALNIVGLGADEIGLGLASDVIAVAYEIIIWFWYLFCAYVIWVYVWNVFKYLQNAGEGKKFKVW